METRILRGASPGSLKLAVRILFEGGLVAFPTDTVYGLGAIATNQQAIDQLYVVKGRDTSKAIAVLVGDPMAVAQVAGEMNELARNLSRIFWPGPLTLVIPANPGLPVNLSSTPYIGVRMPDHPIALQLLRLSGPLVVSSANLSGMPDSRTAQQVYDQLGGRIPLILDGGDTPGGEPSTVVDCSRNELIILRKGPISSDRLKEAMP